MAERRDEILALLRDHQVVVVSGETGSGKTTQLPKMCLELGRGVTGMIGHTQPRRIAARTVAERIAEELNVPLGGAVGYAVRFRDEVGPDTMVKVMTDGILLAELHRDRDLRGYDTIIVDEAHERSLNIDFLLGYLKSLLPRRPDLKVIVTSATIDTARFSAHFDDAPVIEVTGRTYPVEVRYRPLDASADADEDAGQETDDEPRDQLRAITDALGELSREGPGDVLVFLSGEREIRDTAEAVRRLDLPDTEVVPLYARLSAAEQHRVFRPHSGRRVVLATNVAETSLTVPGIRYVIDPGMARVSRYNRRTKVQRLPIEPVSRASADQRAGRCGRTGPGICIRLYPQEDYEGRPEFTDPEILRTNLAAVILSMSAIGLGDVAGFPFVDPPDARSIRDGVDLLEELGALTDGGRLTQLGRRLAQLPLDPRLGRMVLEAERLGCVREVVVIAAALSIIDPRERPAERAGDADALHARFRRPGSDFLSYLALWDYVQERQGELSASAFRRLCRRELLNHQRIREWQDICSQIRQVNRELGIRSHQGTPEPADPDAVHRALLSGLLSHVGTWDPARKDYLGARNARFSIANGSVLSGSSSRWVMAGELVETNRMWARTVGRIRPEWAEALGAHLVKRSHGEPYWDERRAAAVCDERVTLYGLPLVAARRTNLARIDPVTARDMFIEQALLDGRWSRPGPSHEFLRHNASVLEEARELEERSRRRDTVVGEDVLFDFFDQRVGSGVVSGDSFDRWWREIRVSQPRLLDLSLDLVLERGKDSLDPSAYPEQWIDGDLVLDVTYVNDPTSPDDGVSVHVPLPLLERVAGPGFDWHIPALREELVTALIRSLPKSLRRQLVPAPERARELLKRVGPADGPLAPVLSRAIWEDHGLVVPEESWDRSRLPAHLRVNFVVEDSTGAVLASSRDLPSLQSELARRARREVASIFRGLERSALTEFPPEGVERVVQASWQGRVVYGYPALVDLGTSVSLRVFGTISSQADSMWAGLRRLLVMGSPGVTRALRSLSNRTKLSISRSEYASVADLLADCTEAAADELMAAAGAPVWTRDGYDRLLAGVREGLPARTLRLVANAGEILAAAAGVRARLDAAGPSVPAAALEDMRSQLAWLTGEGFIARAGAERLDDLMRYLEAIEHRLERAAAAPARDAPWMAQVHAVEDEWLEAVSGRPALARSGPSQEILWMIQELRVSLFAQKLGTRRPVSPERIGRAVLDLGRSESMPPDREMARPA